MPHTTDPNCTCQPRVVRLKEQPAFRMRGVYVPIILQWPDAALNSSADYHVDFSDQLCCDETLVDAAFALDCGLLSWGGRPTYTPSQASAWITWTKLGRHDIEVSVVTSGGRSLTAVVSITITDPQSLLPGGKPALAFNVLTLEDGTPLTTETGNDLLSQ